MLHVVEVLCATKYTHCFPHDKLNFVLVCKILASLKIKIDVGGREVDWQYT